MDIVIHALNIAALDADNNRWQRYLDPDRQTAASRYHFCADRARCVGAGLLLALVIRQFAPDHRLPPEIAFTDAKKPYLPALPHLHFNLSHSGNWAVCASGNWPLGVDIERMDRAACNVARRCFSPAECAYLDEQPESARQGAFFDIWTLKESYLKATGLGLRLPLKEFSMLPEKPPRLRHPQQTEPYTPALCAFEEGYRLAVTIRGPGPLRTIVREISPADLRRALEA